MSTGKNILQYIFDRHSLLPVLMSVLFAFHTFEIYAQEERCGNELFQQYMDEHPDYKAQVDAINLATLKPNAQKIAAGTILEIPVVVNVIHLGEPVGTGTNLSDAVILGAIQGANDRWRKVIGEGVDMEVEFCLAQYDPHGNPSNGINRVNGSGVSLYTDYGISYVGAIGSPGAWEPTIKDLSNWPHNYVFNIWVVNKIAGGWGGYCFFPLTTNYPTDGVVITAGGMNYNSSTLAHELGHGMGLFHTFQGAEGGCPANSDCKTQGDWVCDTPPHQQSDCPASACNDSPDSMLSAKNYMSYCGGRNLFTQGQKDRSRSIILTTSRKDLLKSYACVRPCDTAFTHIALVTCDPLAASVHYDTLATSKGCDSIIITTTTAIPAPDANFTFSSGTGNVMIFHNTSQHATSYLWNFGDDSTSTETELTHDYATGGTYNVSLVAYDSCGSDTAFSTVTLITTGLKGNKNSSVLLYPNPNRGTFTLEMEVTNNDTYVEITNALGQTMEQQVLSPGRHHVISLKNTLPKGMYQLQLRKNNQVVGGTTLSIY